VEGSREGNDIKAARLLLDSAPWRDFTGHVRFEKGDILVRQGSASLDGALWVDGYDESDRLMVHLLTGGRLQFLPAGSEHQFRRVDAAERAALPFRKARFVLAGDAEPFSGWTDGQTCQGWATPRFESEEAQRLMGLLYPQDGHFDTEHNAFVTPSEEGDPEVWAGESIRTSDGSEITVYPIGAFAWCWREIRV
jgi:hypothetical protein